MYRETATYDFLHRVETFSVSSWEGNIGRGRKWWQLPSHLRVDGISSYRISDIEYGSTFYY